MHTSTLLLRLTCDLMVAAGISPDVGEARRYVEDKLREYVLAEPALAETKTCRSCPMQDPARLAALDGLAGAFLQVSEHLELLAEPPGPTISGPPRQSW
jgi:hypothetical protein